MKIIFQICLFSVALACLTCVTQNRRGKSHSKTSKFSRNIAKHYEAASKKHTGKHKHVRSTTSCPFNQNLVCDNANKYQSFDGTCNNLKNGLYGAANTPYARFLAPSYDDGLNSPRTKATDAGSLPNPRTISTTIVNDDSRSDNKWTHLFAIFGNLKRFKYIIYLKMNFRKCNRSIYDP